MQSVNLLNSFLEAIDENFKANSEVITKLAESMYETIQDGGVIQLFGVKAGEEFVNELFFRAGGLSPFHGIKVSNLLTKGLVSQEAIDDDSVYSDLSLIEKFNANCKFDDRDAYVFITEKGNEPLVLEMAKQAKAKGQKVFAVVNQKTYEKENGSLLDLADLAITTTLDATDFVTIYEGYRLGQLFGTVVNVLAQCIEAEIYKIYVREGKEAPVLLSANVKGADVHNNALTDVYEGRVR